MHSRVPYAPTRGSRLRYIGRHERGLSRAARSVWPGLGAGGRGRDRLRVCARRRVPRHPLQRQERRHRCHPRLLEGRPPEPGGGHVPVGRAVRGGALVRHRVPLHLSPPPHGRLGGRPRSDVLRDERRQSHGNEDVLASLPVSASTSRSEEHTSELQSLAYLVCRLLLEKKKNKEQLACTSNQVYELV